MPFEKGHSLSNGRPKGSKNKFQVGDDIKQHISDLLAYKTDRDFEDFDSMSPYERQRLKNELRKYTIPTMKAIELDNKESQEKKNEDYIQRLMDIPEENFDNYHDRD